VQTNKIIYLPDNHTFPHTCIHVNGTVRDCASILSVGYFHPRLCVFIISYLPN